MKFVAFWEYYPEDFEKLMKKNEKIRQDRLQHPDKYPTNLCLLDKTGVAFGLIGLSKGFSLMEVDSAEQLRTVSRNYAPELRFTFVPIIQTEGTNR
jgi:hypothetical protein